MIPHRTSSNFVYLRRIVMHCGKMAATPLDRSAFAANEAGISLGEVVTLGSLIQKDLEHAYFLPSYPSTYCKEYSLLNDKKYKVFDYPSPAIMHYEYIFPLRNLPAVGDKVPVVLDQHPPEYLLTHWNKWLSVFPSPVLKTVEEGLKDDIPIVTIQALQSIPEKKQSIEPDLLYKLQLKSIIPEIGVPCPRHFDEGNIQFPCLVKVDQSYDGKGNRLANNEIELSEILKEIREDLGWQGGIVFQEMIQNVREVPGVQFYLHRSGEVYWLGTTLGEFTTFRWKRSTVDWEKQDYYKNLVEEFTIPIAKYLKKEGYFGVISFEVLITDHGKYLVDLNPRFSADTTHLLVANYMAQLGYKHSGISPCITIKTLAKKMVKKADEINALNDTGKIVVMSSADDSNECTLFLSVFARTREDVDIFFDKLTNF